MLVYFFPHVAIAHNNPVEMLSDAELHWHSFPLFLASDSEQLSVWGALILMSVINQLLSF